MEGLDWLLSTTPQRLSWLAGFVLAAIGWGMGGQGGSLSAVRDKRCERFDGTTTGHCFRALVACDMFPAPIQVVYRVQ